MEFEALDKMRVCLISDAVMQRNSYSPPFILLPEQESTVEYLTATGFPPLSDRGPLNLLIILCHWTYFTYVSQLICYSNLYSPPSPTESKYSRLKILIIQTQHIM